MPPADGASLVQGQLWRDARPALEQLVTAGLVATRSGAVAILCGAARAGRPPMRSAMSRTTPAPVESRLGHPPRTAAVSLLALRRRRVRLRRAGDRRPAAGSEPSPPSGLRRAGCRRASPRSPSIPAQVVRIGETGSWPRPATCGCSSSLGSLTGLRLAIVEARPPARDRDAPAGHPRDPRRVPA